MKTETAFFLRKRPASNNASAGIIMNTNAPARIIQVVSPVSSPNENTIIPYYINLRWIVGKQNFKKNFYPIDVKQNP